MHKILKRTLSAVLLTSSLFLPSKASALDGAALLTSCANAINDPQYTRNTIATILGFASATDLETAISNGTITVWIANGPGVIPGSAGSNGNSRDLYCGDSYDNSVPYMDSSVNTRDFFFGGAGNDSLTATMWYSTFYGGPGNDYVNNLQEQSFFYGGPGVDAFGTISTGVWASTFDQGVDPIGVTSLTFAGGSTQLTYRTSTTVTLILNVAAKATFYASGKRITTCIKRVATGSNSTFTATCNWRPTVLGNTTLSVTATSIDAGDSISFTFPSKIWVTSRTNKR